MAKSKQLRLLKPAKSDYGGDLQTRRAGRRHGRPLSTRSTMHLVLRSTKARGERSFLRAQNKNAVRAILRKFSGKFAVQILSMAIVGNHIHLHIRLVNRFMYFPFIRAVTGGIAQTVGCMSGEASASMDGVLVTPSGEEVASSATNSKRFWDRRPFTRIVTCFADFKNVVRYIRMNEIETSGFSRADARQMVDVEFESG